MFYTNHLNSIRLVITIVLLSATQLQATICYTNEGISPYGQKIFMLGLEHWANDEESIKQAMYLTALFQKNRNIKFLVEYNDLYEKLGAQYNPDTTESVDQALRAAAYPHYAYAYDDLEEVVAAFAPCLTKGTIQSASNGLTDIAITYSKLPTADTLQQACPVTLFLDAVGKPHGERIIHIDPRRQYLMVSALLTGIINNPDMLLEELVPKLGLDEQFLESFSMQELINTTDILVQEITDWLNHINDSAFKNLVTTWLLGMRYHQEGLRLKLRLLEENVCTALDLYREDLNLDHSTLLFFDRWLKSLHTAKYRSKAMCYDKIQKDFVAFRKLLSDVFNYHAHIAALNACLNNASPNPIFLIAGIEHVVAAQLALELLGYTFNKSITNIRNYSLPPSRCTSMLHHIFKQIPTII